MLTAAGDQNAILTEKKKKNLKTDKISQSKHKKETYCRNC